MVMLVSAQLDVVVVQVGFTFGGRRDDAIFPMVW
jgi:hypothetical protein